MTETETLKFTDNAFDDISLNIALCKAKYSSLIIHVLEIVGMLWERDNSYENVGEAIEEADEFIEQLRIENGYALE